MAWRPAYQPQLLQALCGRFVALQRGQALRPGLPTRQAEALRLRLLDFDIFFFGTAITFLFGADLASDEAEANTEG